MCVKQIKISFLIVGHTHADVDALIGTIVSYLRNIDQMSPEEFAEAVGEACKSHDGTIDDIENTLSTADYESNFGANKMRADIDGIAECREIRLAEPDDGSNDYVLLHYKVQYGYCRRKIISKIIQVDSTKRGWLPRPAPISRQYCPSAWDMFKEMNPGAGMYFNSLCYVSQNMFLKIYML